MTMPTADIMSDAADHNQPSSPGSDSRVHDTSNNLISGSIPTFDRTVEPGSEGRRWLSNYETWLKDYNKRAESLKALRAHEQQEALEDGRRQDSQTELS
ncbi:hypothetical protein V5O48_017208 [Marasmius crinis-equi]|uniref:Uncharacterized protein n=1 Tax=Marasmius crinis-equi TaxID=585013 RepID=A0ABR3EPK2_9AGAR